MASPNDAPHDEGRSPPLRDAASFVMLAFAAGAVNGGAFLACERFIASVTSTLSRIGLHAGTWIMAEYALTLLAFMLGAACSVVAIQARALRARPPRILAPLLVVVAVLFAVAIAGGCGHFGELGTRAPGAQGLLLLCSLACAMGLMNATISNSSELAVRTTHMTGQATDFAVDLARAFVSSGA